MTRKLFAVGLVLAVIAGGLVGATAIGGAQGDVRQWLMPPTTTPPTTTQPSETFTVKLAQLTGDVTYRIPGSDWQGAGDGQVLNPRDEIRTGPGSSVRLECSDGSLVDVHKLTQLRVGSLSTAERRGDFRLQVEMGEITAYLRRQQGMESDFSIQTPTATASVRGSQMTVAYDPSSRVTSVSVQGNQAAVQPMTWRAPAPLIG